MKTEETDTEVAALSTTVLQMNETLKALKSSMRERTDALARQLPGLAHDDFSFDSRMELGKKLNSPSFDLPEALERFGYELHGKVLKYVATDTKRYPNLSVSHDLDVNRLPPDLFRHLYLYHVHYPRIRKNLRTKRTKNENKRKREEVTEAPPVKKVTFLLPDPASTDTDALEDVKEEDDIDPWNQW